MVGEFFFGIVGDIFFGRVGKIVFDSLGEILFVGWTGFVLIRSKLFFSLKVFCSKNSYDGNFFYIEKVYD